MDQTKHKDACLDIPSDLTELRSAGGGAARSQGGAPPRRPARPARQECSVHITFKNAENHFVKRIWNTFFKLDALCYYRMLDVLTFLCTLEVIDIVTAALSCVFNSIMFKSFKIFSTPEFKNFHYDENKNIIKNLYNFARNTIKQVTTVKVPKSRSKTCLVFGFLFCILPEFILRKIVLGPLMIVTFGLLLMTSWVGVFIFIPLFYLLWYIIKFVSKIILVFLAITTTIILTICVFLSAGLYFVFMTVFMLTIGIVLFFIYPLLFVLRVVILSAVTVIYYVLRALSMTKSCCFITDSSARIGSCDRADELRSVTLPINVVQTLEVS